MSEPWEPCCERNWIGAHWWRYGGDENDPMEHCRQCGIRREPIDGGYEYTDRDGLPLTASMVAGRRRKA